LLRYREALGDEIGEIPEGLYPGDYLVPVGEALAEEYGRDLLQMPEDEALAIVKDRAIDAMMAMIRDDLAALNVHHDVFFSERDLHADGAKRIRTAINDLTMNGHVYKGNAAAAEGPASRGLGRSRADPVPVDRRGRRYRSSAGQVGRLLHLFRCRCRLFHGQVQARLFEEMIYVLGADHGGYVKRLEALRGPFPAARPS
jgi:arginyl-tRNA synthetase